MRRAAVVVAALAASLALASCGGSGTPSVKPPQGPPSARHPASQLAAALAAEEMRAHLISASRLYFNGKFGLASAHMKTVEDEYAKITRAVRVRDGALDREFHAAFGVIGAEIARHAPAPVVMNRMGLMQGQLLDAAIEDSVSKPALNDPGVTAEVMLRLAQEGARDYAIAAAEGFTDRGRRAYQDAFGLIARASSLAHRISASLGPQHDAIVGSLADAHTIGFATGIFMPRHRPAARISADVARARAAVQARFGFAA